MFICLCVYVFMCLCVYVFVLVCFSVEIRHMRQPALAHSCSAISVFGQHTQKVVISLLRSLVGQEMWFSPTRPGFESREEIFAVLKAQKSSSIASVLT